MKNKKCKENHVPSLANPNIYIYIYIFIFDEHIILTNSNGNYYREHQKHHESAKLYEITLFLTGWSVIKHYKNGWVIVYVKFKYWPQAKF